MYGQQQTKIKDMKSNNKCTRKRKQKQKQAQAHENRDKSKQTTANTKAKQCHPDSNSIVEMLSLQK